MQVRLLGPVDVVVGGEPRPVPGLRRKAVLATLALQSGEIVSVSQLVETVWGDSTPLTAVNTLQSHVSHLRHVPGSKPVPAQLPPAVPSFAGRGVELARLDALLPPAAPANPVQPGTAVVSVLSGTAGVVVPSPFSRHRFRPQLKAAGRLGPAVCTAAGAAGTIGVAAAGAAVPTMAVTVAAAMMMTARAPRRALPPVARTAALALCPQAAGRGDMRHGRPVS
jgi:Transcriptional regulatory protein, C terminal